MAVGGNVEVRSLTDFQAVNNLYVSGSILTSGSILLGFSLVDGDSDLILSSSATSRIVISGNLDVLGSILQNGNSVSTPVTGSGDFDLRGKIYSTLGEVTLSSSNITFTGSNITAIATTHKWFIGGNQQLEISNNNGFLVGTDLRMDSSRMIMNNNSANPVRIAMSLPTTGHPTLINNGGSLLVAGSTEVQGTVFANNGVVVTGSIRAGGGHLILSSSAGSQVTVSGTLVATTDLQANSGKVNLGAAANRAAFRGSGAEEASLERIDGSAYAGLRLNWAILNGLGGISAETNGARIGDTSLNAGTYVSIDGIAGSVKSPTRPLILSGSGGVYVSGTLYVSELTASGDINIGAPGGSINTIRTTDNGQFIFKKRGADIFHALTFGTELSTNPAFRFTAASVPTIEALNGSFNSTYSTFLAGIIGAQTRFVASGQGTSLNADSSHLILSSSAGSRITISGSSLAIIANGSSPAVFTVSGDALSVSAPGGITLSSPTSFNNAATANGALNVAAAGANSLNLTNAAGRIANTVGHLILSSSAGSRVTVSGNLHIVGNVTADGTGLGGSDTAAIANFKHTGSANWDKPWYYAGIIVAASFSQTTVPIDNLRALPFIAPARGGTLSSIGFNVITGGAIGSVARCGIYTNSSTSNLYPDTLVVDSGEFDTTTTGEKTATINVTLTAGKLYWFVVLTGVSEPTLKTFVTNIPASITGFTNLGGTLQGLLTVSQAYGALPATFTAGGSTSDQQWPVIGVKFSA